MSVFQSDSEVVRWLCEGILVLPHRRPIQISSPFLSFRGWEGAIFIERSVLSTLIFENQQISMPVVSTALRKSKYRAGPYRQSPPTCFSKFISLAILSVSLLSFTSSSFPYLSATSICHSQACPVFSFKPALKLNLLQQQTYTSGLFTTNWESFKLGASTLSLQTILLKCDFCQSHPNAKSISESLCYLSVSIYWAPAYTQAVGWQVEYKYTSVLKSSLSPTPCFFLCLPLCPYWVYISCVYY